MKTFLKVLRDIILAGLMFLVPVFVLFVIFMKAWTSLSSKKKGLGLLSGDRLPAAATLG